VLVEQAVLEQAAAPAERDMSEYLDALRQSIAALPAKQREVVLMHYLEETSVNEVAALLSVSAKAVEGRLYQARQTLRRLLDDRLSFAQQFTSSRILRMLLCL